MFSRMKKCWPCRQRDPDAETPMENEGAVWAAEDLGLALQAIPSPSYLSAEVILTPTFPLPFEVEVVSTTTDLDTDSNHETSLVIPQTFVASVRPNTEYVDLVSLLVSTFNSSDNRTDSMPRLSGEKVECVRALLASTTKPEFKSSSIFGSYRGQVKKHTLGIEIGPVNCGYVLDLLQRRNENDVVVIYINLENDGPPVPGSWSNDSSIYGMEAMFYKNASASSSECYSGYPLGIDPTTFSEEGLVVTKKLLLEMGQLERDHIMSYWNKVDNARNKMIAKWVKEAKINLDKQDKCAR